MNGRLVPIAENLWVLRYPLRLLGMQIGRTVTIIRLSNGKLVIHSTAPFDGGDVTAIRALGDPAWMLDATRFHDSCAAEGRAAFPHAVYLVPDAFPLRDRLRATPLTTAPDGWQGELELRRIDGMPNVQEHAFFHPATRTLIVADLLFNFPADSSWWTKLVARWVLRLDRLVGTSFVFRSMIRDRQAFHRSMEDVLAWDFDRVIVGHGTIVETGGKELLRRAVGNLK